MDEMEDVSSSVRPVALPCPEPLEMADAHSLIAISDCKTPLKAASIPFCGSSSTPVVTESLTPAKGMIFEDEDAALEFYKAYAHVAGFSVRIGQRTIRNGVLQWRRYYCARRGWKDEKGKDKVDVTVKRSYESKLSRCGCEAMFGIKRTKDNKFRLETFVEVHNHGFVSPNKQHLIRSNREVTEKAKTTLFACHQASIGTSGAFRYLHVSEGGFQNVGCTRRDLQNYHRTLRESIKSSDAQMFLDNLARKNENNAAFYFDYVIDDKGRLVHVFWADATCRKNYVHFGELLSFDTTYNTNQYEMVFAPFMGVNNHGGCVLFGAALLLNQTIETFKWLFHTFLRCMGSVAPRLIITDEDAAMKKAIELVFPTITHRLCMWHILNKLPTKIRPDLRDNKLFYSRVNSCVYPSETPEEFESQWAAIISEFGLEDNEWLAGRYRIRASWVPAYFMDVPLAGILRTTSRSESANSFFNRFIGYKHALVEFWIRFDTAVEEQRQKELREDHATFHTKPQLKTPWALEQHGSEVFTHMVFSKFQKEVIAARDKCVVESTAQVCDLKVTAVNEDGKKVRKVTCDTNTMIAQCSCMLLGTHGIPCRHIILALRGALLNELPSHYVLKRWTADCKREVVFDENGNVLEEKPKDPTEEEIKKLASEMRKDLEDLIHRSSPSLPYMQNARGKLKKFMHEINQEIPVHQQSRVEEVEAYLGCGIPDQIDILPPTDKLTRGKCKRNRPGENKQKSTGKAARMCRTCNEIGTHDSRNCPSRKQAK